MPQLDKITFLSQYFWLLVFYIGFFLLIQKIYLPRFGRILLYRDKKLSTIDTTNAILDKGSAVSNLFDQISGRISGELVSLYTNFFAVSKSAKSESAGLDVEKSLGFSQSLYSRYCDSFFELITKNRVSMDPSTFYYGDHNLKKNQSIRRYGDRHPFFYFFFKNINTQI